MGVDIGAYRRFRRDEQKRKPGSCAPEGEEKRADAFELNAASCAVLGYVCLCAHAVIIPGKRHFGFKRAQWPPLNRGLRGESGRCADKEKALPWGRGGDAVCDCGVPACKRPWKEEGKEKGLGIVGKGRLKPKGHAPAGVGLPTGLLHSRRKRSPT